MYSDQEDSQVQEMEHYNPWAYGTAGSTEVRLMKTSMVSTQSEQALKNWEKMAGERATSTGKVKYSALADCSMVPAVTHSPDQHQRGRCPKTHKPADVDVTDPGLDVSKRSRSQWSWREKASLAPLWREKVIGKETAGRNGNKGDGSGEGRDTGPGRRKVADNKK